jgi:hypothetical protein
MEDRDYTITSAVEYISETGTYQERAAGGRFIDVNKKSGALKRIT